MMPNGVEQALADAELALATMAPDSMWRSDATLMREIALVLSGSVDEARDDLLAAYDAARALQATDVQSTAQAQLALLESRRNAWLPAARHAEEAMSVVTTAGLEYYALTALAHVAAARVALHRGQHGEARAAITRAHRLRPLMDHCLPWLTVQVGIEMTRAHLALGETDAARATLADAVRIFERRPDLGSLRDDAEEMAGHLAATSGPGTWAINLTAAELRLLPYLATHLTFPEIGDRLFITSHTVRSEAKAIYRKLDVASRNQAIERAVDVGLLEPMFPHRPNVAV